MPEPSRSLPLPSDTSAPAAARRHTREVLGRWNLRGLAEPVLLVVSELVTNAVRHGRPTVWLRLGRTDGDVRVEVHDGSEAVSGPGETGPDAESGRGLDIVRALSASSGVAPHDEGGKVTWATVNEESRTDRQG